MSNKFLQRGDVIDIVAGAGGVTKDTLWGGTDFGGVYLETAASGATVAVAVEGCFKVPKKTGTGQDFAVGEKVYRLATGSGKAAPVTGAGTKIPLGFAIAAAVTGATEVDIKLSRF